MANSSKSHFLISPYETKSMKIQNSCIKTSSSEELLGTKIDSNLTFYDMIISHLYAQKLIKNLVLYQEYQSTLTYINEILHFLTI